MPVTKSPLKPKSRPIHPVRASRPARSSSPHAPKKLFATPIENAWVPIIDRLLNGFQLNQIELATRILNCSPRSLILWKNHHAPNPAALLRLKELDRLLSALTELMPPKDVGPWMKHTNEYLDPLTPIETLSRGEIDRLWHIIHNTRTGMPT